MEIPQPVSGPGVILVGPLTLLAVGDEPVAVPVTIVALAILLRDLSDQLRCGYTDHRANDGTLCAVFVRGKRTTNHRAAQSAKRRILFGRGAGYEGCKNKGKWKQVTSHFVLRLVSLQLQSTVTRRGRFRNDEVARISTDTAPGA
jgi:hypothetical protein